MAESSNPTQIPSSPGVTPKEEPITLDRPESPNPFLPADQVEFSFQEIALTTNKEVTLLYPSHSNSKYFKVVLDFISKCGIRGDIGITTFRNALRAHYLPHSSGKTGGHNQISNKDAIILYCLANGVEVDYAKLIWGGYNSQDEQENQGKEKVKALGVNGEVSGSRVRVVWMVVDGGNMRARLVSKEVEELALDAMEYNDQDKWNEEDDFKLFSQREGSSHDPRDRVHLRMCKDGEVERFFSSEAVEHVANASVWMVFIFGVIKNGATLPKIQVVEGVTIEIPITTAEEKAHKRLEVKARSTLMMGIPNEHQLKFNTIKDAKKLTLQRYHEDLPRVQGQDFDALPTNEEIMSFLRELGHTGEINSLNDAVFKNLASPQLTTVLVLPKEPTKKSKKVKRPAKKYSKAPAGGVVIRETPEMPLSKKKEKMTVEKRKGICLLSKDKDDSNNEQDSRSEGSDRERDNDDDDTQSDKDEDELVKTPSNDSDDETKMYDKAEGDEDEEMDYTTSQLYDDTRVLVTNSSHSSDLAAKFLNFADIPTTEAEIVSPMDVHVHQKVPSKQIPTLLTVPILVIIDTSPIYSTIIPQSISSFTLPPPQSTPTPPSTTKSTNPPSTLLDFASKTSKDAKLTKGLKSKESKSDSSKDDKSQSKSSGKSVQSEEPKFVVADSDMQQDQEGNLGNDDDEPMKVTLSKQQTMSNPLFFNQPRPPDKYILNEKEVQKKMCAQCLISLRGCLVGREQKSFIYKRKQTMLNPLFFDQPRPPDKALLEKLDWENSEGEVTWVEVMRKYRYGYQKEIVVQRANNDLYKFKEGDFLHLRINDIEDMLLLVVQNRLTNLSGDDVFDFTIALRMFTRNIVTKKRVEDLQLAVKSYQKKINITKPETTKLASKKGPIHSISRPSRIHLC
uniref:Uncharacterized protein n=1 Tax=Tanacetum cinerariifolium TaxID=118510 RepID=A0A699GIX7_TANCI|nr:hypothetical protein [Tanacetum cinerariifolium]